MQNILEMSCFDNNWSPPEVDIGKVISEAREEAVGCESDVYLYIFKIERYIVFLCIVYDWMGNIANTKRLLFTRVLNGRGKKNCSLPITA